MNDYISREAVWEMLEKAHIISNGEYCGYCTEDIFIDDIPSADVQPVKRGVWKKHTVCENRNNGTTHIYEYSEDYMTCSNCWHSFNYCDNDTERFNYCPNCGALMQDEQPPKNAL